MPAEPTSDRGHFLTEPECLRLRGWFHKPLVTQVAGSQHVHPLLHDGDFGAQRSEHGRIRCRSWRRPAIEDGDLNRIRQVEHRCRHSTPDGRAGLVPVAIIDVIAGDGGLSWPVVATRMVWVDEPAMATIRRRGYASAGCAPTSFLADRAGPRQQVGQGDRSLHAVACAVQLALVHADEVKQPHATFWMGSCLC